MRISSGTMSRIKCLVFLSTLHFPLLQSGYSSISGATPGAFLGQLPGVLCCLGTKGRAGDLVQVILHMQRGGLSGFGLHIKANLKGSPGFVQSAMLFLQVQSAKP